MTELQAMYECGKILAVMIAAGVGVLALAAVIVHSEIAEGWL